MQLQEVIAAVRKRAEQPETRTDCSESRPSPLGAPATYETIAFTESQLGFTLHRLHRDLLVQVGNGGFGPGDGLVGLQGGVPDAEGRDLLALREILWLDAENPLPRHVVPLCDWGDAIWSCLQSQTGQVLVLDESGLKDTGDSFPDWIWRWAIGESIWERTVTFKEHTGIDPFTRQPRTSVLVAGTKGTFYRP